MAKASGREKTPTAVRNEILERDEYMCRGCGAKGPSAGGTATLHVHHSDPDPDHGDRHDPGNLVTLCTDCHAWLHKRPDSDAVPFRISDADRDVLRPHDYEILQVLADDGPLSTGEIQEKLTVEVSSLTVRERLWLLMGLDYEVEDRDSPLVDQSAKTGEWGLVDQIEESERGRIPDDTQSLIRRVHDERVRRALARGCDRDVVTNLFDIAERTSWHKQRRAQAYDFPLHALERGGSAESTRDRSDVAGDDSEKTTKSAVPADAQQRLDAIDDGESDSDDMATSTVSEDESTIETGGASGSSVTAEELNQAVETLRAVVEQVSSN